MFTNPPFLWALLGILLIGSEMLIPSFEIFFFGAGALLTGILAWLIPGLDSRFGLQALIWLGSSVTSFVLLRKRFAGIFRGAVHRVDEEQDSGHLAEVIEAITPETPGRIKYQGTTWKAITYTEAFKAGDKVEILRKENMAFIVSEPVYPIEEMHPENTPEE